MPSLKSMQRTLAAHTDAVISRFDTSGNGSRRTSIRRFQQKRIIDVVKPALLLPVNLTHVEQIFGFHHPRKVAY